MKKLVLGTSIVLVVALLSGVYLMDQKSDENSDSSQNIDSPDEGSLKDGTNNTTDDQETVRPEEESAPPPPPSS